MGTSLVWQQALALDARYNAYRTPNNAQFRTQYIRRRSQLLRENAKNVDPAVRKRYLHLRAQLLAQRYGSVSEASSMRSGSIMGSTTQLDRTESSQSQLPHEDRMELSPKKSTGRLVPTYQAEASKAMVGGKSVSENYAFAGMHHIFDDNVGHAATSVKFANDEKNLLAYSSICGSVSICQLAPDAKVLRTLKGHVKGVTDFAWSLSNDLIVTVSCDATVKLWQTGNGNNLRNIASSMIGMTECPIRCCLFQPINNNMVVLGNSSGQVTVVNISTGKTRKGANGRLSGSVLSMSFDSSGKILWVGNDRVSSRSCRGNIYSFSFDLATGQLRKGHQMVVHAGCPVTSIQSRSWISREARDPSVLVNVAADVLCLYRVTDDKGMLQHKRSFPISHRKHNLRSVFCPLMSFRQGACVVTASEDMNVCFFDIERSYKPCVNRLQGHSSVVLGVSFNCNESMLASCDTEGVVIIWKREQ